MITVPVWQITETNALERRNLFSVASGREAHIATIISGSCLRLDRFDECIRLIESIPSMIGALKKARETLQTISFLEDEGLKATRVELEQLFGRIDGQRLGL
jgi:hypothetical protein